VAKWASRNEAGGAELGGRPIRSTGELAAKFHDRRVTRGPLLLGLRRVAVDGAVRSSPVGFRAPPDVVADDWAHA